MGRQRLLRLAAWGAVAVCCVPLAAAYAFAVYDAGSRGGVGRVTKRLRMAALVLPALVALAPLVRRDLAARRGAAAAGPVAWLQGGWASLTALFVLLVALFTLAVDHNQPAEPDAFYDAPTPLPDGPPGTVIRAAPLPGAPAGAKAWKILYHSTSHDGTPTAVSGMLIVPQTPAPPGGRPVIAWAHQTTGVGRNCAPSLRTNWAARIAGLGPFLRRGYVVVATDYAGMGAGGAHGYLVGETAARNVLDSVRAARAFAAAEAGARFAVWGASQGGHAALFVGEIAAAYAPEIALVGVAAAAPPTDLTALLDHHLRTDSGNVLGAFAFTTWARVYPEARLEQIVTPLARPVVRNLASYSFFVRRERLSIVPGALLTRVTFLSGHPKEKEPWGRLFIENSPGRRRIPAPVLIAQGEEDALIRPAVTRAYVAALRAAGDTVEYRGYPGVGHVLTAQAAAPDVVAWLDDRFALGSNQ